ncbi:MAG TPA: ABC transporter ATP-binding protein [Casimicrobiaceae bacterium]|nr:ABC transporter ATP-binding protein [Casimicrobiaceae bacterium]
MSAPLVSISDLFVRFSRAGQTISAVNGVSFELAPGEVLGVLGESGSGKTVTLRAMLRILPAHRSTVSGAIRIAGRDVLALRGADLEDYRGGTVSMIFQEPMLAFDPVFTIGQQIAESVRRHLRVDASAARARALEMLDCVQIPSAKRRLDAYPHEMSGGMRQRAMIALALACKPKLLLADEPTTALDATVQIQILLLLRELQREFGMSVIFVTHDVGVAIEVADRLAVMYAGRIIETGGVGEVIRSPRHPYTQGLLSSTVRGELRGKRIEAIPGSPPDLAALPAGCAFAPRCRLAQAECVRAVPESIDVGSGHSARCVLLPQAA